MQRVTSSWACSTSVIPTAARARKRRRACACAQAAQLQPTRTRCPRAMACASASRISLGSCGFGQAWRSCRRRAGQPLPLHAACCAVQHAYRAMTCESLSGSCSMRRDYLNRV